VVQVRCQASYLDVRHGPDDGNRTRTVSLGICAFREGYASVPRTRRRTDVGDLSDAVLCR
jgi:hypothetical protein